MQHLGEREFGYDKERLGFPSVSACRAFVFLTTGGLFGFHDLGNNNPDTQWKPAARAFADYVANHAQAGSGLHFYVVSKVTSESGYFGDEQKQWRAEAKTFAKALGFKGPISGYNLSVSAGSKYVEFRRTGSTCVILVKPWTRNDATDQVTKADYVNTPDHVMSVFGKSNMPAKIITDVGTNGLNTVVPELLRK
jgi:hypothetical protein